MATYLSSNKYVCETPKVGDCMCVRGHKPIAMGEILVVNALGPVDSVHVGLGADHGVVGASSAGHSMIVTVAPIRSAARSVAALHGCLIPPRHRGTSENFHRRALRPPRAIGEAEPSGYEHAAFPAEANLRYGRNWTGDGFRGQDRSPRVRSYDMN